MNVVRPAMGMAGKLIADSVYSCKACSTNAGSNGGAGGAQGAGGSTSAALCLANWRSNSPCGAYCTGQTQADRANCKAFLDCYKNNDCGPGTCGAPDQVCGVNVVTPKMGSAPREIANLVYECMACPGSIPTSTCNGKIDTTPCTDGNACSTNDRCQQNTCKSGSPVVCTAVDQCHSAGTCSTSSGTCNNPIKAGCTVTAAPEWTVAATNDRMFGKVVARADGTLLAPGTRGLYRVSSTGSVATFAPALGEDYLFDSVEGAHAGAPVGNDFVLYDMGGNEVARAVQPDAANVYLVPGRPIIVLAQTTGEDNLIRTTSVRFIGAGRDITIPVRDFRRSFLTHDYYVWTSTTETIIEDYSGVELRRYPTGADAMAASLSSRAFAFVPHGTTDVVLVDLPAEQFLSRTNLDGPVWNLALSPDGRFAIATTKQRAYLFLDGALIASQAIAVDYVVSADVSNEGVAVLGTQNKDKTTRLVGIGSSGVNGFVLNRPSKDSRGFHPYVAFAPSGQSFVSSERNGASKFTITLTP